jgi:hypothetical protein
MSISLPMASPTISETITKTPKDQFVDHVKRWVTIESQQKIINEKVKRLREMKSESSEFICKYITENNIQQKILITDGELKVYEKKEYSPITFGYIEKCLAEIIPEKANVDFILNHLKEKREITLSKDIRKSSSKNKSYKSNE